MRILLAAAEATPLVKVGGLADVAGALPTALARLGHDVRLALPHTAQVATGRMTGGRLPGKSGVRVQLVSDAILSDAPVYGGENEGDRYLRFCDGVVDLVRDPRWRPDVLHAHDWHAALAIVRLADARSADRRLDAVRTVLTIHNLAYQGIQGPGFAERHGLEVPPVAGDTYQDCVNPFGRGIASADAVTTVSRTYAREILEPIAGHGLDALLRSRGVTGIVNGLDQDVFDPATDQALAAPFDAARLDAREACRAGLAEELGLAATGPLIGLVSRLAEQKGLDLLLDAAPTILAAGARIAVLGTGDHRVEEALRQLARDHPGRVAAALRFDDGLARRVYAGSDIFCMPSLFEPCGTGQLIAMRYGAVPLVRRTGGLADTVAACDVAAGTGTGFLFDDVDAGALLDAVERALAVFADRPAWEALQRRGMAHDSSWDASARQYEGLYAAIGAATAGAVR